MYQDIQKFIKLLKYGELLNTLLLIQYTCNIITMVKYSLISHFFTLYSSGWFGYLSCQCSAEWSLCIAQFKVSRLLCVITVVVIFGV